MKCRNCNTQLEHIFVDLGASPPSNSFLFPDQINEPEVYYPLKAMICHSCLLVQLDEFKSNKEIFSDNYAYFSSYSQSWLDHAQAYVEMIVKRLDLSEFSNVIEIASNDGYLLQYFNEKGIPCLGIEPSSNTAEVAIKKGVETITRFFNTELAKELVMGDRKADLIIGNNVLAHDPDLNELVEGMRLVLKYDGVITLEFPHILNLIEQNQFDTIYHEHYSYFSLYTAIRIFESHKLEIYDVEELETHGGSLRIYARHKVNDLLTKTSNVEMVLDKEKRAGLHKLNGYSDFTNRINSIKYELIDFLIRSKKEGKTVFGYGAAAKGNTLLNYSGIKPDLLPMVIDRSPHKQGKLLPGSRIPVVDESKIVEMQPDYILILPWNISDEIISQLCYVRDWGCKFVIPIPKLTII